MKLSLALCVREVISGGWSDEKIGFMRDFLGRQKVVPIGLYRGLKIALVSDELTRSCLVRECVIRDVTPLNYRFLLKYWKPDLLFVESAWQGYRDCWKYRIAAYPEHVKRNNLKLCKVVAYARDRAIPTVFWNKEDGVHFERFIDSARLFDHVFTVDEKCIPRYRAVVEPEVSVNTLMFAAPSATHDFSGFSFKHHRANFVGSYSNHIHDQRRQWQDMMFEAATGLGVTVFDRNSGRRSGNYRYPEFTNLEVRSAVPHAATAQIYKDYLVSLNVNTIVDSPTMFSRRLVEILACGGIAVTNPSPSVDRLFKDYCHIVADKDAAFSLFDRLKHGPSKDDLDRARAGAEYVLREHTCAHRLEEIVRVLGL